MQARQRADLKRAAHEGLRIVVRRAVVMRNAGVITDAQFNLFESIIDDASFEARVELTMDGFEPSSDVQEALNELYPIPNLLRNGGPGPRDRNVIARIERAIEALTGGGPR